MGPIRERLIRNAAVWDLAASAFLVLHVILAWSVRRPGILTGQDDATFLILAESLQDFQYRDLFRVDAPIHNRYPPGFPAVLALWDPLVGGRFDGLVALIIAFSTAGLAVFYRTVARLWSRPLALAAMAPAAVISEQVVQAGMIWSETPYLFFSMLALSALADEPPGRSKPLRAGALAIWAALTRSVGVALIAAVAFQWVLERRKVAASLFVGASALTMGAWLLWTAVSPEQHIGKSYFRDLTLPSQSGEVTGPLGTVLERVIRNGGGYLYPQLAYQLAVPNLRGTSLDNLGVAVALGVALFTGLVMLYRRWRIASLYLVSYGGILLIWPWFFPNRHLIPILPLMFLAVLTGLSSLTQRTVARLNARSEEGRPGPRVAAWVVVFGFSLATTTWGLARTASRYLMERGCERGTTPPSVSCLSPDVASYFAALEHVRSALPQDAVLLSIAPETTYYYTGRKSPSIDDALLQRRDGFLPFLRDHGTGYILLGSLQPSEIGRLTDWLKANCENLALERAFPPRTYLFRLRADGEPAADDGCSAVTAARRDNAGRSFVTGP